MQGEFLFLSPGSFFSSLCFGRWCLEQPAVGRLPFRSPPASNKSPCACIHRSVGRSVSWSNATPCSPRQDQVQFAGDHITWDVAEPREGDGVLRLHWDDEMWLGINVSALYFPLLPAAPLTLPAGHSKERGDHAAAGVADLQPKSGQWPDRHQSRTQRPRCPLRSQGASFRRKDQSPLLCLPD